MFRLRHEVSDAQIRDHWKIIRSSDVNINLFIRKETVKLQLIPVIWCKRENWKHRNKEKEGKKVRTSQIRDHWKIIRSSDVNINLFIRKETVKLQLIPVIWCKRENWKHRNKEKEGKKVRTSQKYRVLY